MTLSSPDDPAVPQTGAFLLHVFVSRSAAVTVLESMEAEDGPRSEIWEGCAHPARCDEGCVEGCVEHCSHSPWKVNLLTWAGALSRRGVVSTVCDSLGCRCDTNEVVLRSCWMLACRSKYGLAVAAARDL